MRLEDYIRDIQDFPKPGIIYKDITPLLQNPEAMREAVNRFLDELGGAEIQKVVGIESRGFFFATLLAEKLNAGFVPIRKPGKLPYKTLRERYSLEYGEDTLEIHCDGILPGEKVLIHDDVLATGGTAAAACKLIEKMGGEIVQCNFLMDLAFLKGKEKLTPNKIVSLFTF
ncbi:adenine phosphoribosyltransferase [Salinimicrobium marinum]|uniref:Adenine phosphoribosyltransferase n=1 Tax=Salinimicrobium marinum TaxID=680283 RepID=A0A918S7A1_9FLAO|nr:adenine phosphoribosyltransferase [Salinimicrobium marinum]GHA28039.1 adenine phosphoribosyltransferase [Salinimicrobium marinum]